MDDVHTALHWYPGEFNTLCKCLRHRFLFSNVRLNKAPKAFVVFCFLKVYFFSSSLLSLLWSCVEKVGPWKWRNEPLVSVEIPPSDKD